MPVRWTYIIPRFVIVALLWMFTAWGLDPLLRYSAVQSLQAITGARADISHFTTQLYPPRVVVRGVALASAKQPGLNLIEFDELEFHLAGDPLLRRRFVVQEGRLTGVRFSTRRSDDGQLERPPAEPDDSQPSWVAEQIRTLGDEWLTKLVEQGRQKLDPNVLETWRTGTEIYDKWDDRFTSLADRGRLLEPRFQQLKIQFENARQGDTLQQIQQYVQVAEQAERLTREAEQIRRELSGVVPEVREDFVRLDQARRNDQEMIGHQLELLKPDSRRITESLIGEQLYVQLQQLLSWIQLARDYQQQLQEQTQPERGRGRDIQYPLLHPTPDFHLQRLLVSGELTIEGETVPFEAVVQDVTEDAPLLGRPCVVRLKADGSRPLIVQLTLDKTRPVAVTQLAASWSDPQGQLLHTGKPDSAMLSARLADIDWRMQVSLAQEQLQGRVQLTSRFQDAVFTTSDSLRPELAQAAGDALSSIHSVGATLHLGGTLTSPDMSLESDLGSQISDGMHLAFANQLQNAKARLADEVNSFAADQVSRLKTRFASEYDQLVQENAQLIAQVQEVQSVVAAVQSGRVDPNAVFRQVTDSRVLSDKQQQSVGRVLQGADKLLQRRRSVEPGSR